VVFFLEPDDCDEILQRQIFKRHHLVRLTASTPSNLR
jgi:hypothetical protein